MTADVVEECSPLLRFPWKLHQMLNDSHEAGADTIVSWLSHGRGFKVHESETFVKQVMARYFKQTKYKSFQRQLNMWGFERVTEGAHKGSYCHDHFVKGQESLCAKMIRTKIKGTGIRKGSISSSIVETTTTPPSPPKRVVSSEFSTGVPHDNREDTTAANASCAGEKNASLVLCAAAEDEEGMIMKAVIAKAGNNLDQKEQEECWMGNSISSLIFEDHHDEEGGQQAERLASSKRSSSMLCSIFFDACDAGMGQNQQQEERPQSKRRRSSSTRSILFDGDRASSISFGGRSFYVVDDYNPPHPPVFLRGTTI